MAYQEARAAAIGATVALGLAGDGPELQRMVRLAPALAPADDSLLDILQHITTMPPGPGYDALVQLLESRSQVRPRAPLQALLTKTTSIHTVSAPIGVTPLVLISNEQDQAWHAREQPMQPGMRDQVSRRCYTSHFSIH